MSAWVERAKTPIRKPTKAESSPEPGIDADEKARRARVVIPAAIKASWKASPTPIAFIRSLKTGSLSSMVLDILNK
jgi:hypothetical protein